jgi:hypothetical protein
MRCEMVGGGHSRDLLDVVPAFAGTTSVYFEPPVRLTILVPVRIGTLRSTHPTFFASIA